MRKEVESAYRIAENGDWLPTEVVGLKIDLKPRQEVLPSRQDRGLLQE